MFSCSFAPESASRLLLGTITMLLGILRCSSPPTNGTWMIVSATIHQSRPPCLQWCRSVYFLDCKFRSFSAETRYACHSTGSLDVVALKMNCFQLTIATQSEIFLLLAFSLDTTASVAFWPFLSFPQNPIQLLSGRLADAAPLPKSGLESLYKKKSKTNHISQLYGKRPLRCLSSCSLICNLVSFLHQLFCCSQTLSRSKLGASADQEPEQICSLNTYISLDLSNLVSQIRY